jgi:hydrogenase maturation protease
MMLVIGLGNPILGDDAVGWRIVEQVQKQINDDTRVEFDFLSLGGLSLMERMIGYEQVILVDAIVTGNYPVGTVLTNSIDRLPNRAIGHLCSAHDTTIQNALAMGRSMGAHLPDQIYVITVESQSVYNFSEELTPEVQAAVPEAVNKVLAYI